MSHLEADLEEQISPLFPFDSILLLLQVSHIDHDALLIVKDDFSTLKCDSFIYSIPAILQIFVLTCVDKRLA